MDHIDYLKVIFPINCVNDIISVLECLISRHKTETSILSLLLGWYENSLTIQNKTALPYDEELFPVMDWDLFSTLYSEYVKIVNLCRENVKDVSEEKIVIKKVSDFVWGYLANPYFKDKSHIQSMYSFLKGKQLDCYGIAITVLSILKTLGFHNIHLALSEDHAWLTYNNGTETAEVTWHGKDKKKRGEPINDGCDVIIEKCWLYLGCRYVACDDIMELVSIVNAMNPGINSKTDSDIISSIQQKLLGWLYNKEHLTKFPIAICNLADLEEIEPSAPPCSFSIETLYKEAIEINKSCYENSQIYPYTYFAGYFFRKKKYKEAIAIWRKAAEIISRYNYSKEDEEAYKEFNEITNIMLPIAIRPKECDVRQEHMKQIFEDIIMYLDHVSVWEEDSKTPIFHEAWAKSCIKIFATFSDAFRVENIKCFQLNEQKVVLNENMVDMEQTKDASENRCLHLSTSIEECDVRESETVKLRSKKMHDIVNILSQNKLNKNAIRLRLCTMVNVSKNSNTVTDAAVSSYSGRSKRQRIR